MRKRRLAFCGMRLAARGIAFAAKGDIASAKIEQQAYLAAMALVPPEESAGPNTGQGILAVVTPMLMGEILYRDGEVDEGLAKLRDAVKAEDALRYSEPPGRSRSRAETPRRKSNAPRFPSRT